MPAVGRRPAFVEAIIATSPVLVGLGANQGDRAAALLGALTAMEARGIRVLRASPVYASRFVGPGPPQPEYLNAVAEVVPAQRPLSMLEILQGIETAQGRAPGTHLRPRPLDLDVLFWGGVRIRHPRLVVPHPRVTERRFVLQPLADLGVLEVLPIAGLKRALQRVSAQQELRPIGPLLRQGGHFVLAA